MNNKKTTLHAFDIRALIRALALQAENDQRKHRGESMAYTERDFLELLDKNDSAVEKERPKEKKSSIAGQWASSAELYPQYRVVLETNQDGLTFATPEYRDKDAMGETCWIGASDSIEAFHSLLTALENGSIKLKETI